MANDNSMGNNKSIKDKNSIKYDATIRDESTAPNNSVIHDKVVIKIEKSSYDESINNNENTIQDEEVNKNMIKGIVFINPENTAHDKSVIHDKVVIKIEKISYDESINDNENTIQDEEVNKIFKQNYNCNEIDSSSQLHEEIFLDDLMIKIERNDTDSLVINDEGCEDAKIIDVEPLAVDMKSENHLMCHRRCNERINLPDLQKLSTVQVKREKIDCSNDIVSNTDMNVVEIFKRPKTNAEMCKKYYNRKKAAKEAEKIRLGLFVEKPKRKTGAERTRAWRQRKKMLSQSNESAVSEILSIPSTSSSRISSFEPTFQLTTPSASTSRPDVSTLCNTGITDNDGVDNHVKLKPTEIVYIKMEYEEPEATVESNKLNHRLMNNTCLETSSIRKIKINQKSDQMTYTCDVCEKSFRQRWQINKHMKTHSNVKPFSCDVCEKSFRIKSKLTRHLSVHSNQKTTSCDICKKVFRRASNLFLHLKLHAGEKPFSCDTCNMQFKYKNDLRKHIKYHTGVRPFSCEICHKTFVLRHKLARHRVIHSGEKRYVCDVCNKSFTEKGNLQRHIRTHDGVKLYSCKICKKKFSESGVLRRHLKLLHANEKPYECNICFKSYSTNSDLKVHLLKEHQNNVNLAKK